MDLELLTQSRIRIVTASPEPVHGQPAVTTETLTPKVRKRITPEASAVALHYVGPARDRLAGGLAGGGDSVWPAGDVTALGSDTMRT